MPPKQKKQVFSFSIVMKLSLTITNSVAQIILIMYLMLARYLCISTLNMNERVQDFLHERMSSI